MAKDRYYEGLILLCKYSKNTYVITRTERDKKTGYKKYWIKGRGKNSAESRNSKSSLKSLYVIGNAAAQVLYGS